MPSIWPRFRYLHLLALFLLLTTLFASARDLRITIPRRGIETPVQRLNREGVREVQKHNYKRAEALFYRAYLDDPSDPFTLNNLGYISELQGHLDRADKFYKLAAEQASTAAIDLSSAKQLQGEPMTAAIHSLKNNRMRINQLNVEAIEMLSKHRPFEAESILRRALAIDTHNPFTLNNLGVAEESTGNFPSALNQFDAAAASRSLQPVVVTFDRRWRGRPISEIAAQNSLTLQKRLNTMTPQQQQAMTLTIRGVSALEQNRWNVARQAFLKAYSLDADDAFTLNNRGYVAEREGHLESAQFYYAKAWKAENADMLVGWATNSYARDTNIDSIARSNNHQVNTALEAYREIRREQPEPIKLIPRYHGIVQPAPTPMPR